MTRRVLVAWFSVLQVVLAGCSTSFHGFRQAVPVSVRPELPAEVRVYALTTGEVVAGPAEVPTVVRLPRGEAASAPKLAVISLPGYCPRYRILEARYTKLYETEEILAVFTLGVSWLFAAVDQWLGGAFRYAPDRLRTRVREGTCDVE